MSEHANNVTDEGDWVGNDGRLERVIFDAEHYFRNEDKGN